MFGNPEPRKRNMFVSDFNEIRQRNQTSLISTKSDDVTENVRTKDRAWISSNERRLFFDQQGYWGFSSLHHVR